MMVIEKLEHSPIDDPPKPPEAYDAVSVLHDLANDYRDLRVRADSIEAQLTTLSARIAEVEGRLFTTVTHGDPQPAQEVGAIKGMERVGRAIANAASASPELSSKADLDTITFERAKSLPHPLEDSLILGRKDAVWKTVGGGAERFRNSIYDSLVMTTVDESDISFMKIPDAGKIFPYKLEMLRERWAKKARGSSEHNKNMAYANIYEQQGTFTHFHSDAFTKAVARGEGVEVDSRFYLNPRLSDSISILDEIMTEANGKGLVVSGKINGNQLRVYPEFYQKQKNQYDSGARNLSDTKIRTDNLVLYCTAGERDKLLEIIKRVYVDHQASFVGRACPVVPLKVADGFSVGEEPKGLSEKESLTGLTARVLHQAMVDADNRTWLQANGEISDVSDERWLAEVRSAWSVLATRHGINEANIAFRQ